MTDKKNTSSPEENLGTKNIKTKPAKKSGKEPRAADEHTALIRAVPIVLVAFALFITLCFITGQTGAFGNFISKALKGLFSYMAYTIPAFILIHAITFSSDFKERRILSRVIFSLVSIITLSMIAFIIPNIQDPGAVVFSASAFYEDGILGVGGGFIGSIIAFALTKLFGYVGLLIIIAVIFAIYAILFFCRERSSVSGFFLKKLAAFFNLGARMEKRASEKKVKRAKEKSAKKRAAEEKKHAKFFDDDFFYTDNGVSKLEIPELGIVETKDGGSYILRDTVSHGEESEGEEQEEEAKRDEVRRTVSTGYEATVSQQSDETRTDDIIIEVKDEEEPEKPEAKPHRETLTDLGIDDSADAIFTSSFDPYDIALNEKYASKPSSRAQEAAEDPRGFSEYIDDLTPEDAERLERLRRFEASRDAAMRRKLEAEAAAAKEAEERMAEERRLEEQREAEAAAAREAELRAVEERRAAELREQEAANAEQETTENADAISTEEPNEQPRSFVPISEVTGDYDRQFGSVRRGEGYRFVADTATSEVRIPYSASDPKVDYNTDVSSSNAYGSVARTVYNDTPLTEAPKTESPTYAPISEVPKAETTTYAPVSEVPKAESPTYAPVSEAPKAETPTYTPISEVPKVETPTYTPVSEAPKADVPTYTLTPEASKTEVPTYSPMAAAPTVTYSTVDDEQPEEEEEETAGGTIEITRTPIGDFGRSEERRFGLDFSDEEDEDEDFDDTDAEETEAPTEIPPEEQNPDIAGYRKMFDIFKNGEDDKAPEESTDESFDENDYVIDSTDNDEAADDGFAFDKAEELDYGDPEDEIDSDGAEEDDEPPFDEPVIVSAPEKKEQKKPLVPDYSHYKFPPIDLLKKSEADDFEKINEELQEGSERLINALDAFNITATVRAVERGPRITRYSIVPAKGIRVNQIERLSDDIALAMAAETIRIEAPIPGKSAVGVEVPNQISSIVSLRDLLEADEFVNDKSKTVVCIGKSVEGKLVFGDLSKMPHLLIAGATGMGKSVCMNALITSILYKARPDEVKFIMIDPKKVEFSPYDGIPHLLVPVITETKQAAGTLMWAVDEMNKRYDIIGKLCVRNIDSYNERVAENPELGAPMSKIIIFIDELNDLMIQVRDPVENLIMLIAQKARAAGIHLVIGTQRPSVNVITGVIKANIPSRIACKVSSGIDSRTILENTGAEKLIGKGDMLFAPGGKPNPTRVQGAFVSETETAAVVEFVKNQVKGAVMYDEQAMEDMKRAAAKCDKSKDGGSDFDDDEESDVGYLHDRKFLDAVELAIRNGSVATSFLQRKLRIGYGKAAQYIDIMEDLGIVGEKNGSKPRDILISMPEWQEKLSRLTLDD